MKANRLKIFSLYALIFVALMPLVFANGKEHGDSVADQFNELLPFEHISEGHAVATIVSIILWLSLVYTIYSVFKLATKKGKK